MAHVGRRPTAADVARLSGVSRATVSYVLNNKAGQSISGSTSDRVRWAAGELGYVPSAAAAALRRGHSQIVLLVIDRELHGYVSELFISGAIRTLSAKGYVVLTHEVESEESLLAAARAIQPLGAVSLALMMPSTKRRLGEAGVHHVVAFEGDPQSPLERPWEEAIGRLQAEYLLGAGYTRLFYALPESSPRAPVALARLAGVQAACAERGAAAPVMLSLSADRREIARKLQGMGAEPEGRALCCFDDQLAFAVLAALSDLGWKAPEDFAVVGADDNPVAALTTPALTTVQIRGNELGEGAAELFLNLVDGLDPSPIDWQHLPLAVIARDSA